MQIDKNKISVIVPIYKVENYLDECVQSIISQTYKNLQIILVDDGSPDSCGSKCDWWKKQDNRIQVIHKKNGGLSDARNAGLLAAQGDYIAFIDSDDWIEPHMFDTMLNALLDENADIVACGIIDSFPDHSSVYPLVPCVGSSEDILKLIYNDTKFPVAACNKLYKRSLWNEFKFPKGKICEDAFTTYLLVDRADKIVQIPDALYHYRIRSNSIMTAPFSTKRMDEEEAWRCNYEYMELHYPKIANSAFDFYLQKVQVLILTIPENEYDKFKPQFSYLFTILQKNINHILFESSVKLKNKAAFLLNFTRLKKIEKQHRQ